MKQSCEIIKDLIPLCSEGICSDESKHDVEEHIKECEKCRILYEHVPESQNGAPIETPDKYTTLKKTNILFRKLTLRSAVLVILILVLAVIVGRLMFAQIVKGEDMRSFETIAQSYEVKKVTKLILDGNFEEAIDYIAADQDEISLTDPQNADNIRNIYVRTLSEAYENAFAGKKVSDISVSTKYQTSISMKPRPVSTAVVKLNDGNKLELSFFKYSNGRYLVTVSSFSECSDSLNDFINALDFANISNTTYKRYWTESALSKTGSTAHASSLYLHCFSDECKEAASEGVNAFIDAGFRVTEATLSDIRYDSENDSLYHVLSMSAADDIGTAAMSCRLYIESDGIVSPERNNIQIFTNGCSDALAIALKGFFGT